MLSRTVNESLAMRVLCVWVCVITLGMLDCSFVPAHSEVSVFAIFPVVANKHSVKQLTITRLVPRKCLTERGRTPKLVSPGSQCHWRKGKGMHMHRNCLSNNLILRQMKQSNQTAGKQQNKTPKSLDKAHSI